MGVKLLGTPVEAIDRAEDRELFKEAMEKIGQPLIPSATATEVTQALAIAEKIGYPVIVRPAFTLGGAGGGVAYKDVYKRQSFNRISVDGDTSTNDMCCVLANGMAGNAEITAEGEDLSLIHT